MRRNPLRLILVFALLAIIVIATVGPRVRSVSRLMAAESAELAAYLPAIFVQGDGSSATPTRPPKGTETVEPTPDGTAMATHTPTPIATNTPISFATSTPGFHPETPTSTPTPTPQSSQAVVLRNDSWYVDQAHDLHVVGEVKNNGATTIQFVNVKAVFYTRSGFELQNATEYAAVTILPPGEKTCFEFVLPKPQGFSYYQFVGVDHLPLSYPLPTLSVSNVLASYDPNHGFFNLAGKITNTGAEEWREIMAVGTLYDANSIVRGCQKENAGLDGESHSLFAGQSIPFQMAFTGRDNEDVTTYRLQADGRYPEPEE